MDWNQYNKIMVLQSSGKPEEALSEYGDLLKECTDQHDRGLILLSIANCLTMLDRSLEARQSLNEAFSIVEKDSSLYPSLAYKDATMDADMGNWNKALSKMDAILKKCSTVLARPENEGLIEKLNSARGIALVEVGRFQEALPLLNKAASVEKETVLCHLGSCYYHLGELEKAKACFLEALTFDLDPSAQFGAYY